MSKYLTDLREGASACLKNANRLLEDSRILFDKKSYQSCFLLSQLSLEELAKGFRLMEKHLKKKEFSREEWGNFTKHGRKTHRNKLKYLKELEDKWAAEATRGLGPDADYFQTLKLIAEATTWAKNVDDYRKKLAETDYKWRLKGLYVDYDWERKQWFDPSKDPIFNGVFLNHDICLVSISKAENFSDELEEILQEEKKEGSQ